MRFYPVDRGHMNESAVAAIAASDSRHSVVMALQNCMIIFGLPADGNSVYFVDLGTINMMMPGNAIFSTAVSPAWKWKISAPPSRFTRCHTHFRTFITCLLCNLVKLINKYKTKIDFYFVWIDWGCIKHQYFLPINKSSQISVARCPDFWPKFKCPARSIKLLK